MLGNKKRPPKIEQNSWMALSYHKRDTIQTFNKMKMFDHDLALAYEKMSK